jgi:hypothetical protein
MTGSEPLIAAAIASAVSGVAVPVFQSLWGGGGKLARLLGKTLDEKAKRAIFAASKQYEQNYVERHGILKVLGMREPVSLESVYTAVQFLDDRLSVVSSQWKRLNKFTAKPNNAVFSLKIARRKRDSKLLMKSNI